jgi:hypothetical protein
VLIPARDEAARLGATLDAVLASEALHFEVLVLDDGSSDATPTIVQQYARCDARVRLISGSVLPAGWSGKQYACYQLAQAAAHDVLIWLDADVRVRADALSRAVRALEASKARLLSGFPFQRTGSWSEHLVVPMMHLLLLGYLPMWAMRWLPHPALAAGCGQFFIADRDAYQVVGGHARIAGSFHDGLTLPRAFRHAGLHTDIFDATDSATCRMYERLGQLWAGFVKNAHEGMAGPVALPAWTMLLFVGHVLPWVLLASYLTPLGADLSLAPMVGSCALAAFCSLALGWRFHHPRLALIARPAGVLLLLAIQWHALVRRGRGQPTPWRGRHQPEDDTPTALVSPDVSSVSGDTS